jgi:hypothetical protein
MGKYDKDRYQKEMALRYCLAQGILPFLEVVVPSLTDLTESQEVLTDLDVLGLEFVADGDFHRLLFDCKTTNKMSPINRAFWAAGVLKFTNANEAFVILKNRAVFNHRLSALSVGVDLHDDSSFEDLGNSRAIGFNGDHFYQSSIDRWNLLYDAWSKNSWSISVFDVCHNVAPVTLQYARCFRKVISELRSVRGEFSPTKLDHVAILLDCLASIFVVWSGMARDIRRFYDPRMKKEDFERTLRYYVWGGKEQYSIRSELRQKVTGVTDANDFPAWNSLVKLAGIVVSGPNEVFGCARFSRELALRLLDGSDSSKDLILLADLKANKRIRQFILGMGDYLIEACGLPKDFSLAIEAAFPR